MNDTLTKELIAFTVESHLPGMGGWGNGYVAIPEGHPCFGLDYDQIHSKFEIEVNGGLTFADDYHRNQPEGTRGMWIVGFDTLHAWDTPIKWPRSSVVLETEKLRLQLENLIETKEYKVDKIRNAAPELLEACQEMIKHITETDFDVCGTPDELLNKWKAAIKKVTT